MRMRTLILAMGLAAMATTPAIAQVARGSATTGTSATTSGVLTSNTGIDGRALTAPSGESSSSATTNSSGTAATSTTAGGSGSITNVQTNPAAANPTNSFGPNGSFANDSGNSALGLSPGQTSSGTAAGNSSAGFATDSSTLGVAPLGVATVVPDGVSVIGGGTTGGGIVSVPAATQSQQVTIAPPARTPLFDQVAREGREKEARRRARGDEPRVYGIAPNTERDLTWQMPDDRIIRY
jgi:hypothetical protein